METLIAIAVLLVIGVLVFWLYDRSTADGYWEAYDKAQEKDLAYAREHPGCSYEEAHRHRDAVMKKYGRY